MQFFCNGVSGFPAVSGQHNQYCMVFFAKRPHGPFGVFLEPVSYHNISAVFAFYKNVNYRVLCLYFIHFHTVKPGHSAIADMDILPFILGADAISGLLFYLGYPGSIIFSAVGVHKRLRNGMIGVILHMSRNLQKFTLCQRFRIDFKHFKHAFRQSSGLIENKGVRLSQHFKIISALYHNTLTGRRCNPAKKSYRHRQDQSRRTGGDQHDHSAVNPGTPLGSG